MPADALHDAILLAVQSDVRALALTGIVDGNVVVQMVPDDRYESFNSLPAILITPAPGSETIVATEGTATKYDVGYPVHVAILAAANQESLSSDREQWLEWREKIVSKFVNRRLTLSTGLTGYSQFDIFVEPGPLADLGAWFEKNLLASVITLRVKVRRARG